MELANSIVTLQPGIYILRHPKTGMPPISISRAAARAEHNGQIQALYTPGTDGAVLRDGKDCIVMQVLQAPVDLLVTAYLGKAGAAVPALKIDRIRLDADETTKSTVEFRQKGISLVGHIERTGDVLANPGETLGNADSELRIEGFQAIWPDKPEGVELTYSAHIEGAGETASTPCGDFCGTRNAAKRLFGLNFGLSGERAANFQLEGEAHFSGGFKSSVSAGKLIQGPTGSEHLTALRVSVKSLSESTQEKQNPWNESARTRVLKSQSKMRGRQA